MKSEIKFCKRSERGQAIVEFGIVSIILLMLAGGAIDTVQIIRYQIAVNGALTEICNQITNTGDVDAICYDVVYVNYAQSLGDGNTTYSNSAGVKLGDGRAYKYYNYDLNTTTAVWSGDRSYVPVTVKMSREQPLLTPFGRLLYGDESIGGKRKIEATATTRIYEN